MPELWVQVTYEPKDESGGPFFEIRDADALVQRLEDVLSDQTKHDEVNGFRVTRVRRLREVVPPLGP
jgi:hypothetical protein